MSENLNDFYYIKGKFNPYFHGDNSPIKISYNQLNSINYKDLKGNWTMQVLNPKSNGTKVCKYLLGHSDFLVTLTGRVTRPVLNEDEFVEKLYHNRLQGIENYLFRFEGDFALSILTETDVYLYRSRASEVPLYYLIQDGSNFTWSSNFLDLANKGDIDCQGIAHLCVGRNTIPFKQNIKLINSGQCIRFSKEGLYIGTGEEDTYDDELYNLSLEEWGKVTRNTIIEEVGKYTEKSQKVGIMLSGGIDSSALTAALVENGKKVVCYNWSSPSFPDADEGEYAKLVANHFQIPLKSINIDNMLSNPSFFLDIDWKFSIPYNHNLYGWWRSAMEHASSEVDCIINGSGADSTFGFSSKSFNLWNYASKLPLRERISYLIHGLSIPHLFIFKKNNINQHQVDNSKIDKWPPRRNIDFFTDDMQSNLNLPTKQTVNYASIQYDSLFFNEWLPKDILMTSPYKSMSIKNIGKKLPNHYRVLPYSGFIINKPVLRLAFLDVLPREIIRRNYANSFSGLIDQFLLKYSGLLKKVINENSFVSQMGIIDVGKFDEVITNKKFLQRNSQTIMNTCMIELWLKSYFEERKESLNAIV